MTNILTFPAAAKPSRARNLARLMTGLARERRLPDDVFWLKENAELLGLLAALDVEVAQDDLAVHAEFYDGIEDRLAFYPQYYRFLLSICLDLEDLGMGGNKGAALCRWVASAGLVEAELSDLQRAEACRLLARRNCGDDAGQGTLGARLRRFMARSATFALPNKKAAYELTHIVFYLSRYGRCDPGLSKAASTSLEFAGLLAYLDQNADLLAEVCMALRFAGAEPSPIWTQAVADAHAAMTPVAVDGETSVQDDFHGYLVTGWAQAVLEGPSFDREVPQGPVAFVSDTPDAPGALRPLSECLFEMGTRRGSDWSHMRGRVLPHLDPRSRIVLGQAEASSDNFDAFFENFARAASLDIARAG